MAVLKHRIEGHAVVLFWQVLAGDARQQPTVHERAIGAVVILAPG
jgi:hypothetical protein